MKIGIIVYSKTGNTLSIAQRVKDKLSAKGHTVTIEQVTNEGEIKPNSPIKLVSVPEPSKYDALIFGSPVMAFSLNPVMKAYLAQIPDVKGKKTGCFVTEGFPYNWMGGSKSIKQMSEMLKAKGIDVCGTGIVHWGEKKREKYAADTVAALCGIF